MGYQNAPATITRTADGKVATPIFDYATKTVAVEIDGVIVGTWRNFEAAKVDLALVDEPVRRQRVKEQW